MHYSASNPNTCTVSIRVRQNPRSASPGERHPYSEEPLPCRQTSVPQSSDKCSAMRVSAPCTVQRLFGSVRRLLSQGRRPLPLLRYDQECLCRSRNRNSITLSQHARRDECRPRGKRHRRDTNGADQDRLINDARHKRRFRSPIHAVRTIWHEHGLRGMYRGFGGTTLKQASATAFRMGTYNILKDYERTH
jgi:hypothetical protein